MSDFENNSPVVSYAAFESVQTRLERTNRRMWILCIILIIALIGTNAGWLYRESQFEDVVAVEQDVEATATGDSDLNLNTVGGDYYGGESKDTTNDN